MIGSLYYVCNQSKSRNDNKDNVDRRKVVCDKIKQKTRKASLNAAQRANRLGRRFEKILFELMVLSQMVVNHLSKHIIAHKKEMSIDGQKILYRI